MAQQTINVGTSANDGTGDTLRAAAQKVNSNFTEVYNTSQAAFNRANTASDSVNNVIPQVQYAWNTANAAYNVANSAAATNIDTWARDQSNVAFDKANVASTTANAAFAKANTANFRSIITVNTGGTTTLDSNSDIVLCDPVVANNDITIVLPDPAITGQIITVKNISNGANDVFIQSNGTQQLELLNGTIGTGLYETLPQIGHTITWVWDQSGSAWRIINAFV